MQRNLENTKKIIFFIQVLKHRFQQKKLTDYLGLKVVKYMQNKNNVSIYSCLVLYLQWKNTSLFTEM
jgi:hypothetical protein